jgi:hypothetical protein
MELIIINLLLIKPLAINLLPGLLKINLILNLDYSNLNSIVKLW